MLADAAGSFRSAPLTVYALHETIAALRRNMLNGELWPDYTVRPSPEQPYIRFRPIAPGEAVELNGRKITALPAKHAIPCVGYRVDSGEASWVYSGDTTLHEEFWQTLNRIPNLKHLLIETTFLNANHAAAAHAGHMTAELLGRGLHLLQRPVKLYIVHMEAGREDEHPARDKRSGRRLPPGAVAARAGVRAITSLATRPLPLAGGGLGWG